MVKREKTTPPAQGIDSSARHGPRREVQAGIESLPKKKDRERPARLPEDVAERFRVK